MRLILALFSIMMLSACKSGPEAKVVSKQNQERYLVIAYEKLFGEDVEAHHGPRFLMRGEQSNCTVDMLLGSAMWFPSRIQADQYVKEHHLELYAEQEAREVLDKMHQCGLPLGFQVSSLQVAGTSRPLTYQPADYPSTSLVYLRLPGQSTNVAGFLYRKERQGLRPTQRSFKILVFDVVYVRNEHELREAVRASKVPIAYVENYPDSMNPGEAKSIIENAQVNR